MSRQPAYITLDEAGYLTLYEEMGPNSAKLSCGEAPRSPITASWPCWLKT